MNLNQISYPGYSPASYLPTLLDSLRASTFGASACGASSGCMPQGLGTSQTPLAAYTAASPEGDRSIFSRIWSFASGLCRSIMDHVASFLSPIFGDTLSSAAGDPLSSSYDTALGSGMLSSGVIPYAATAKKPETLLDKIIAWFKVAGDFGHDVSNGLKDGRDMLSPISSGLNWIWDNAGSIFGSVGQKIGDLFGSIFD